MFRPTILLVTCVLTLSIGGAARGFGADELPSTKELPAPIVQRLVRAFCLDCHGSSDPAAGLDLESVRPIAVAQNTEIWEKVVRKLRTRQMPPSDPMNQLIPTR